ncbi:peptidase inhibitor family I36 protein [Actinoplanes sp. NPDC049265]|uniref:peptidase inhibitor family I36 protein n=1 Tax=Actinoplanes sp. NPDC049265 TaxID=3363902 RepID=UPI00371A0034
MFIAGGAAATLGLVTVFVAPSAAQAAFSDCPADLFCLWTDPDGGGPGIWSKADRPDLRVQNMDDRTSSVANNSTTRGICLYPDLDFDGAWAAYVPARTWANITDSEADDQVTSVRWAPSEDPPACWVVSGSRKTRVAGSAQPFGR